MADEFLAAWKAAGFRLVGHIVFIKNYESRVGYLRARHEQAYLLAKGKPQARRFPLKDVLRWEYTGNKLHPTQKPVSALRPLIGAFSRPGEIVLDPFAGSGSTLIAAEKTGRHARCIEYEPKYCDVIVRRWQAYSGKAALFEGTDLTFEDFEGARASSGRTANQPAVAPPLCEAQP